MVDGHVVGLGTASTAPIYALDTTAFPDGNHSLSAVATTLTGTTVNSGSIGIEIINLKQWRMLICGTNSATPDWVVEANYTQADVTLSANAQNVLVSLVPQQQQGCVPYPLALPFAGASPPGPVQAAISGNTTNPVSFILQLATNPWNGPSQLEGTCFSQQQLLPTNCVGLGSDDFGGHFYLTMSGFKMPAFSGTYSGTLSYASGSKSITATLEQRADYTLSASYADATGTHVSAGTVIGGTFRLPQGFDGNPITAIGICTYPSCSGLYIYDANWNYLGTLQSH